jgi:hypothetical protein
MDLRAGMNNILNFTTTKSTTIYLKQAETASTTPDNPSKYALTAQKQPPTK